MSDCQVRLLDIKENEQAIIRVRTKFHIELVFDGCVIDMFEKDGIVYTRQEHHVPDIDEESVGQSEYDGNAETQAMEGYTQVEEEESPDITRWSGGSFDEVNEAWEIKLQETEDEMQEGYTQIDDFVDETQTEDCYDGDIYIPSYIRMKKYLK